VVYGGAARAAEGGDARAVEGGGCAMCGGFRDLGLEVGEHSTLGRGEAKHRQETNSVVSGEAESLSKSTIRITKHEMDGSDKP
jgi:hypothetical protein